MCLALFSQRPYEAHMKGSRKIQEWEKKEIEGKAENRSLKLWDPAGDFALASSLGNGESEALTQTLGRNVQDLRRKDTRTKSGVIPAIVWDHEGIPRLRFVTHSKPSALLRGDHWTMWGRGNLLLCSAVRYGLYMFGTVCFCRFLPVCSIHLCYPGASCSQIQGTRTVCLSSHCTSYKGHSSERRDVAVHWVVFSEALTGFPPGCLAVMPSRTASIDV